MNSKRPLALAVLAFASSICFSFFILSAISLDQNINPDPDRFGVLAANLANGNGFVYAPGGEPVMEKSPLYPLLIASAFVVTGTSSIVIVQTIQAVFHTLAGLVVFLTAQKMGLRKSAPFAQLLMAIHPLLLWYTGRIWVETLLVLALCVVVFLLIRLFETPTIKNALLAGASIGAAGLAKPIVLPVALIAGAVLLAKTRRVVPAMLIVAMTLAMMLPWAVRNASVSGEVVLTNTSLGFNMVQGDAIAQDWPSGEGIIEHWRRAKIDADSILAGSNAGWESVEGSRVLVAASTSRYVNDPLFFLRKVAVNAMTFCYLSESPAKSLMLAMLQVPLVVVGVVAFVRFNSHERQQTLPLFLVVVLFAGLHSVIVGWGRYSVPLIPVLLLIVAALIEWRGVKAHDPKS